MTMTMTQRILALHSGKEEVRPGEIVEARVDLCLANDITAPLAIKVFEELGVGKPFDREKIALVPDHFVPNKDIASAEQVKMVREFAKKYGISHFFELGETGVEHILLPEKGLIAPGDLVVGADSHTCTYGALGAFATGVGSTDLGVTMATGRIWLKVPETLKFEYKGRLRPFVGGKDLILHTISLIGVDGANYKTMFFTGETVKGLTMADRFTMANMAVEAGAKNGIFEPDEATEEFLKGRTNKKGLWLKEDPEAKFEKEYFIDVSSLGPQVARPHSPANSVEVEELKGTKVDQVFIGSCTNGRYEDLYHAFQVLKGRKVAKGVRLIVLPGTPAVYKQALQSGIIEGLLESGAVIGPPCCGPCLGGHMGILAESEVAVSTTNRNFLGRMGHPKSLVYLSNPFVAAASAVAGEIIHPKYVLGVKDD